MDSRTQPSLNETVAGSDLCKRFQDLHRFVSGGTLSREEIRYLKVLLSTFNTDPICELPIELVKQIVVQLEPKHFARCLAVSKGWRHTFLSSPIISAAARRYWPYLVQISWKGQVDEHAFLHMLHRTGWGQRRRKQSQDLVVSFTLQGPVFTKCPADSAPINSPLVSPRGDALPDVTRSVRYSHGRLAWTPGGCDIVVYNLRSKTQTTFSVPSGPLAGPRIRIEAIGEKLVVGSVDRLIAAWDHTIGLHREKKLPGSVKRCTVMGFRTAIVLFNGDVFVWEFGGKLSTIPTASLTTEMGLDAASATSWASNLHAIIDPYCNTTLWLASCCFCSIGSKPIFRQTVHVFKNQDLMKSYIFDLPVPSHLREVSLSNYTATEGQWSIQFIPDESNTITFCKDEVYSAGGQHQSASVTYFDLYSRQFTYEELEGETLREFRIRSNPFDPCDLDFRVDFASDYSFLSISSLQPGFQF